jgi:hypothetical protein
MASHYDTPERALDLLARAVNGMDAVLALTDMGKHSWFVEFEASAGFIVEWASVHHGLVFIGEVGVPAAAEEAKIVRAALGNNMRWRQSNQLRFALDEASGALTLIDCFDEEGPDDLSQALMRFEANRMAWSLYVHSVQDQPPALIDPFNRFTLRA